MCVSVCLSVYISNVIVCVCVCVFVCLCVCVCVSVCRCVCGVCDGDGALRRRTEFHCILATEHQVMGLEGAWLFRQRT